jgi:hypothetical protein
VLILDPLTGHSGRAAVRRHEGITEVYFQLAPGESLLLRTDLAGASDAPEWHYRSAGGAGTELQGPWQVTFVKGGPDLPAALTVPSLKSWTEFGGEEAQRFGGTARYRLEFTAPPTTADDWLLDLGDVRESARVNLNGREVATAWSLPFRMRVGEFLRPGQNVLEIDVTNLAANRIRDLDRRGVPWKIMRDTNIVRIDYTKFDASQWPLKPSGLLGPVMLVPLRQLTPR